MSRQLPISVGMIVRNEQQLLAQCLSDVRRWVREMVIIDTGSTDRTTDIARRLGARVVELPFSTEDEVRNAYIAESREPWLLVLDADEHIATADLPKLQALIETRGAAGWTFPLRDYTDDWNLLCDWRPCEGAYPEEEKFAGTCGYSQMRVTRLVRRDAVVGYRGICHAKLQFTPRSRDRLREAPFPIHHFACVKRVTGRKQRRYLELLLEEERRGELRPEMVVELAVGLFMRGEHARAWKYAERAIAAAPKAREPYKIAGLIALARGDEAVAASVLRAGLRRDGGAADLRYLLGLAHLRRGDPTGARRALRKVFESVPWHPLAWNALGVLEEQAGDLASARTAFETALRFHPRLKEARANLRQLQQRVRATSSRTSA